MCDELGKDEYMQGYVMEKGKTSLCSAATGAGCSDKEKKFIETLVNKPKDEIVKQIERLAKMGTSSMKADLKTWLNQRLAILKQLEKTAIGKEEL